MLCELLRAVWVRLIFSLEEESELISVQTEAGQLT